jgi:hypothetical protein
MMTNEKLILVKFGDMDMLMEPGDVAVTLTCLIEEAEDEALKQQLTEELRRVLPLIDEALQ